jgi:hypothetical protein
LHWSEQELIYADLDAALQSEDSLRAVVALLPKAHVDVLAVGLLSLSPNVRQHAVSIWERMQQFPSTARAFEALDIQMRRTFSRLVKRRDRESIAASGVSSVQRERDLWRSLTATINMEERGGGGVDGAGASTGGIEASESLFL